MGRGEATAEEMDQRKAQLAREICSAATVFSSCSHRRLAGRNPVFVDWYLVLSIEADATAEVIRKRYRQLALLLHPDKNKHPKAEIAFKLIYEAYACLSDKAKRGAFDSDRENRFCVECSEKPAPQSGGDSTPTTAAAAAAAARRRSGQRTTADQARAHRVLQALREARRRLDEEADVIRRCMRLHEASSRKELPLFDPVDYVLLPGYPHHRTASAQQRGFWFLQPGSLRSKCGGGRRGWCESPVYEMKTRS